MEKLEHAHSHEAEIEALSIKNNSKFETMAKKNMNRLEKSENQISEERHKCKTNKT